MHLRNYIVALVFATVHSFAVFAQQTSVFGYLGNDMFRNPVLPSDYSDPDVIRVGEDYYGIASTFFFSPGMVVIHSKDLVHWEIINHVVDDISFLNPELDWTKMKGYYNGVWAGSLRYHQGTFYCHFATPRGGWFVATTTDIRGKWEVQAMKDANGKELRGRGWDDVCPLWDDDGQAYIIASNFGKNWFPHIYKMSWDGTQLLDGWINKDCDVSQNMEIIGGYVVKPFRTAEANKLYKWNGMYYIYFSEVRNIHGNRVRVPVMRRSKSIYGPYEEQLLMHSQGKDVDKEPNQGAIIDTPEGKWYFFTHHGTGDFDGRVCSVLPVSWTDGWPLIGEDSDGDHVGEMVWELPKPIDGQPAVNMQTSDTFDSSRLGHQWEFNHQPRNDKWSLGERKGHLRLYAFNQLHKGDFFSTGNVISQRYIRWGEGEYIVKFDISKTVEGQETGLAHFNGGKDYACLLVSKQNGEQSIVYRSKSGKGSEQVIPLGTISFRQRNLWLKSVIDFSGKALFYWSTDGKKYTDCHTSFQLKWGSYRGDRIGIFTYNNLQEKGYVDIDEVIYRELKVTGPYEATWESIEKNYRTPEWFKDAKFGIFIHWGVYSVPASGSEWYPRHMYNGLSKEHQQKWGQQRKFGYKDFIPLFKAEHFAPQAWAALFKEAGARYVIPTAEHHDGFAMYESRLTKWNAKQMGPKRDIIGELGAAVRAEGIKFGVSNHRIEHWDFMYPERMNPDSTDLFMPEYAGFYGPQQKPTEQSAMGPKAQATMATGATEAIIDHEAVEGRHPQSNAFLSEWEMRVREIIDRYQPDLFFFDNGINYRSLDPWKQRIAQYYYNSAYHWGKEVSIQSKSEAYPVGSIKDYERQGRAPKEIADHYWQVDDPIGNKFGYIEGLKLQSANGIIRNLVNNISRNGNLCLNISPKSDGTIPDDQQEILRTIGRWLKTYGEAVYETRAYKIYGEGNVRYTCKGDKTLYAFVIRWDGTPFTIQAVNGQDIKDITLLTDGSPVTFRQTDKGVLVEANMTNVADPAVAFRIRLKH